MAVSHHGSDGIVSGCNVVKRHAVRQRGIWWSLIYAVKLKLDTDAVTWVRIGSVGGHRNRRRRGKGCVIGRRGDVYHWWLVSRRISEDGNFRSTQGPVVNLYL